MKHVYFTIIILSFFACKKEYTCECHPKGSTDPVFSSPVFTTNTTLKKAKKQCSDYEAKNSNSFVNECTLK